MTQPKTPPSNRERENEDLRPPGDAGEPPRAATEPPGSEWSVRTDKTLTDAGSGETHEGRRRRTKSADEDSEEPAVATGMLATERPRRD